MDCIRFNHFIYMQINKEIIFGNMVFFNVLRIEQFMYIDI